MLKESMKQYESKVSKEPFNEDEQNEIKVDDGNSIDAITSRFTKNSSTEHIPQMQKKWK